MRFTIVKSIKAQQKLSRQLIRSGKSIAVVPTMGFLHDGHLSLIKKGLSKADIVITTIFVNPTQFAPGEDLTRYPRDEKGDLEKIKQAGSQIVFIPRLTDMYPDDYETYVDVENLTLTLEGESRLQHFKGVTTIVAKLFNIVQPDFALFGMKDYQQAAVITKMIKDLNWPTKIIVCPTVREKDGLAMSSRNSYLTPVQRKQATALYQSLILARQMVKSDERRPSEIRKSMRRLIKNAAPDSDIGYIAFTDLKTLEAKKEITKNTIASVAVNIGPVRLIDNMRIF
ncbi:MAG: pantoate--beta-alanine ligase [candidate division Zixibacteria bacterium]|nr:pantoate--beta-alanine ligase [candidate division Zixibacteria bacterium]